MAEVRLTSFVRDLDLRELAGGVDFVVGDVAFLLQDAGDLRLDLGVRGEHFGFARHCRIAEARQEVGDGIGNWLMSRFRLWSAAASSAAFLAQSRFVGERHAQFGQERLGFVIGRAEVTMVTSKPMLRLILSSSTSGKMDWSVTPRV